MADGKLWTSDDWASEFNLNIEKPAPTPKAELPKCLDALAALFTQTIVGRDNALTGFHRQALAALCGSFADMLESVEEEFGRYAIGAVTGFGKSVSIICTVIAASILGPRRQRGLMVCSEKVEVLIRMKAEIVSEAAKLSKALGFEIDLQKLRDSIGVLHGYDHDPRNIDSRQQHPGFASAPSIEYDDAARFPFLFVTHSRLKSGKPLKGCRIWNRQERGVVFDESFLKSEGIGVQYVELVSALNDATQRAGVDPDLSVDAEPFKVIDFTAQFLKEIVTALAKNPEETEAYLTVPDLETMDAGGAMKILERVFGKNAVPGLLRLFIEDLVGRRLRVLAKPNEERSAVVQFRQLVHEDFRSIIVTDASYHARLLCGLDRTLLDGEVHLPRFQALPRKLASVKSWGGTRWIRMRAGSGRSTMQGIYWNADRREETPWPSKAFAETIKRHRGEKILIIGPKFRSGRKIKVTDDTTGERVKVAERDIFGALLTDLQKLLPAETVSRIRTLTYGQHEGTNDLRDCSLVMFFSMMYRDETELVAAALGQLERIDHPLTKAERLALRDSEAGHVLMQGASRARCREIEIDELGRAFAKPTTIYFMAASDRMFEYAKRAMWEVPKLVDWPAPPEAKRLGRARDQAVLEDVQAVRRVLHRLAMEGVEEISSRKLKAMVFPKMPKDGWGHRLEQALAEAPEGWSRSMTRPRSLVRGKAAEAEVNALFDRP